MGAKLSISQATPGLNQKSKDDHFLLLSCQFQPWDFPASFYSLYSEVCKKTSEFRTSYSWYPATNYHRINWSEPGKKYVKKTNVEPCSRNQ